MRKVTTLLFTIFMLFGFAVTAMGQTLYSEDFTGQDGRGATGPGGSSPTIDLSGVNWTINVDSVDLSATNDFFRVESGVFTGQDIDGTQQSNGTGDGAVWISPSIDIAGYTNIQISLDIGGSGTFEDADFIKASYSIDEGDTTQFGFEFDDAISSAVSFLVSELSGTSLKVFVEMDNNAGTESITFDNVLVEVFYLKGAPTNHVTGFSASSTSIEKVDLSWTDASSGTLPDTYLILANNDNSFTTPSDGTAQSDDTDLSDGSGILNISQGTQSASFSELDPNTQYYFEIYPYTNTGSNIKYKTDGTIPSGNATTLEAPDLLLNEILADPAGDLTGDANGDGTRDSDDDEFLEFVNTGNNDLDISGWKIEDATTNRHTFPSETILKPMQAIVVFGGGSPEDDFGGAIVQTTSSLSLGNGGEQLSVKDGSGNTQIQYTYSGATDQSETRSPDIKGEFSDHSSADTENGSLFSPGTRLDGSTFQPSVSITGSEGWRILSIPTSGNSYADLLDSLWTQGMTGSDSPTNGKANVLTFNGSDFTAVSDLSNTMTAGVGFITYVYSDDDYDGSPEGFPKRLDMFGTENTGSITPTLISGTNTWTLVGNPYNSTIDWDEVLLNTGTENITSTVYVYDHNYGTPSGVDVEATGSAGSYRVWNGSTGSLNNGLIAPFQGFWVQNASSGTPALTIEENDKSSGGTFYKTQDEVVTIKLRGEMENMYSESFLSFTENGEIAKDNFDGLKLSPLEFRPYLSVASVTGNTKLDINNLPQSFDEELSIPVSIEAFTTDMEQGSWVSTGGEVTLSWPEMKNLPEGWSITLNDFNTGATVNMRTSDHYVFDLAETNKAKTGPTMTILNPQPPQAERMAKGSEILRFTVVVSNNSTTSNEPKDTPEAFTLEQNYPNPFNPTTSIQYSVAEAGNVQLTIYNVMGQQVETLVSETKSAGAYRVHWNAANMASGIYYYRMQAGNVVITRQMTLIK